MKFETDFNYSRFQQYSDFLKASGTSQSTIDRKLSSLNSFQKFLIKKNFLNPSLSTIGGDKVDITPNKKINIFKKIFNPPARPNMSTFGGSQPPKNFLSRYLIFGTLIAIILGLGYGLYSQTILKAKQELAYSTAAALVSPGRVLSFQGRLTDTPGNPISSPTDIVFKLYNQGTGGTLLYTSSIGNSQTITPDENGIFSVIIGKTHGNEIPPEVFSENAEVWLEITADNEIMDPRQQIATVAYALNSETLQGLPPSASGLKDTVLVVDGLGNVNLGEISPSIIASSTAPNSTFKIEGQALLLNAANGLDTDYIKIDPVNPNGAIQLVTTGNGSSNAIVATNTNLSTGNLFYGQINNDNRGYNFLSFQNYDVGTTSLSTRFSVGASGNVYISNSLSLGSTTLATNLNADLLDGYHANNLPYDNYQRWVANVGTSYNNINSGTTLSFAAGTGMSISMIGNTLSFNNTSLGTTYAAGVGLTLSSTNIFSLNLGSTNVWLAPQFFTNGIGVTGNSTFQNNLTIGGTFVSVGSTNLVTNLNANYLGGISSTGFLQVGYTGFFNTALNGLSAIGSTGVGLGGTLTQNTTIGTSSFGLSFLGLGNSQALFIGTSGFVGIGTTNPTNKLSIKSNIGPQIHISGSETDLSGMYIGNVDEGNNSNEGVISMGADFTYAAGAINAWTARSTSFGGIRIDNGELNYYADTGLINGNTFTPTSRLTIQQGGNIGIGITSPTQKLDIDGSVNIGGSLAISTNLSLGGTFVSVGSTNLVTNLNANYLNGHPDTYFLDFGDTGPFIQSLTNGVGISISGSGVGRTIAIDYDTANLALTGNKLTTIQGISTAANPTFAKLGLGSTSSSYILNVVGNAYLSTSLTVGTSASILGNLSVGGTFISVGSTNLVTNLNADLLDGYHSSSFLYTASSGITLVGQDFRLNLGSTNVWLAPQFFTNGIGVTGNSTFQNNLTIGGTFVSVGSTNLVTNLNANYLGGISSTGFLQVGYTGFFNTALNGLSAIGSTGVGLGGTLTQNTRLNIGNTDVMYFQLASGNVGIGTTNPTKKLDITGDIKLTGTIFVGAGVTGSNNQVLASNGAGGLQWIAAAGVGTTYAAGVGITLDNTNTFKLNLGSTNVWLAPQFFTNGIGVTGNSTFQNNLTIGGTFVSVGSTNLVTNLNANYLGGISSTGFLQIGQTGSLPYVNAAGVGLSLSGSGPYTLSLNLGSTNVWLAPQFFGAGVGVTGNITVGGTFVSVGSTNLVTNLNANYLNGYAYNNLPYFNSASNGLTAINTNTVGLGGTLTQATQIGVSDFSLSIIGLGGTQSLFIGTSGNVGIGNTNPTHTLDVTGDAYFSDSITVGSTALATNLNADLLDGHHASDFLGDITAGIGISISGTGLGRTIAFDGTQIGNMTFGSGSTFTWTFNSGATASYINFNNGFIGIGTTSPPRTALEVNGSIAAQKFVDLTSYEQYFLDLANSDYNSSSLALDRRGSIKWNSKYVGIGTTGWFTIDNGAASKIENYQSGLLFATSIGTTIGNSAITSWNQNIFLSNNGNVGIGTTNPTSVLELANSSSTFSSLAGDITFDSASGVISLNGGKLSNLSSVQAGSGDKTNPSFSFSSDTDTGIYSGDTNSLMFSTGGTDRVTINASGYLGIGTTNPIYNLEISGGRPSYIDSTAGQINISGSLTGGWAEQFGFVGGIGGTNFGGFGALGMGTTSLSYFWVGNSYSSPTMVWKDKYVGIGTVNPNSPLSVYRAPTDTIGDVSIGLAYHSSGVNVFGFRLAETSFDFNIDRYYGGWQYPSLTIKRSNGNVGIGTTSPTQLLTLNGTGGGSAGLYLNSAVPASNSYTLYNNGGTLMWNGVAVGTSGGSISTGTSGFISKYTTNSTLGNSILFETNSGYIGIGTTAPTSRFQIGSDTVLQQWSGLTPYVLIQGIDNEVATTALQIKDENQNEMFSISSYADSGATGGRAYFGGNVGIGTSSPSKKLDVVGDINLSGTVFVGGGGTGVGVTGSSGQFLASNGTGGLQWVTSIGGGSTYAAINGLSLNGSNQFGLGGALSQNTTINTSSFGLSFLGLGNSKALYISSSGYIGIGTTNPSQRFQVGTGTSGFVVTSSGNVGIGTTNPTSKLEIAGASSTISNTVGDITLDSFSDIISFSGDSLTNFLAAIGSSGSASSPTFSFTDDPDTGLYSGNNNILRLSTGGTDRVTIDASGNVGIGTTNPSSALDISGSNSGDFGIFIKNTNPDAYVNNAFVNNLDNYVYLGIGGSNLSTAYANRGYFENGGASGLSLISSDIRFYNGGTTDADETLRITSTGLIGIGTTNPTKKLDVTGDIKLTGTIFVGAGVTGSNNQVLASNGSGGLQWVTSIGGGSTYAAINGLSLNGSNQFGLGGALSQNTTINTSTYNLSFLGLGDTQSLFIGSSGFVGIGTTNPLYSGLNIDDGGVYITNESPGESSRLLLNTDYEDYFFETYGTSNGTYSGFLTIGNAGFGNMLFLQPSGDISFVGNNFGIGTTSPTGKFQIDIGNTQAFFVGTSGFVGIGTTNPMVKLDVNGGIYIADGSSGSPAFSFRNDTNTGFFRQGNDLLSFVANGQNALNIDGTSGAGRLIIGNGNAVSRLQINDDSNAAASGITFGGNASTYVQMFKSASNQLAIMNASVGIGNSTAYKKLDVVGDINLSGTLFVSSGGTGIGATGASGQFLASNGAGGLQWSTAGGATYYASNGLTMSGTTLNLGGTLTENTTIGTSSFGLSFLGLGDTNALFISPNGYVGIGTTNPSSKLSVYNTPSNTAGNLAIGIGYTEAGSVDVWGFRAAATTYDFNIDRYYGSWQTPALTIQRSTGYIGIGTTSPLGPLHVAIGNTQALFISPNGYVGIGTTNPTGLLHVNVGDTKAFYIASNGKVGVGTTNPAYYLHVEGSQTSGVAFFYNTNAGTGRTQPVVIVKTANTAQGTTGAEFIRFVNAANGKAGRIRLNTSQTSTTYATSATGDLAEYVYSDEEVEETDLISYHPEGKFGKAREGDTIAGTYSNYATFLGNEGIADQPNTFPLSLSGIVDVKISSQNGNIKSGDPISTSNIAGIAAKATKAGSIVGRAIENYSNDNPNSIGLIKIIVSPSIYDPNIFITESGQVAVNYNVSDSVLSSLGYSDTKNEIENATYSITDTTGAVVTKIGQFSQIAAAKINTGLLTAKSILVDNLAAKKIATETIVTGDITATTANLNDINAQKITANEASFSTIYANQIINPDGNISDVFASKITALRDEIKSMISESQNPATPSAIMADASTWDTSVSTSSADLTLDNLALSNDLIIGAQLTVKGLAKLDSANISNILTVGQIALKDNILESTADNLYIQPSGLGTIHFLNDRLVLSSDGNVTINGNLNINGSLVANLLKVNNIETKNLTAEKIIIADSTSASTATSSAQLSTNATVGTITLAAGQTEITLENSHLTPTSMVYLTPTSSTQNQVVYLKSKFISPTPTAPVASDSATLNLPSTFTIAIDQALDHDVNINWWLIN